MSALTYHVTVDQYYQLLVQEHTLIMLILTGHSQLVLAVGISAL